jgi:hypothetical protein
LLNFAKKNRYEKNEKINTGAILSGGGIFFTAGTASFAYGFLKKKILPVLDATVIVLCHTLTYFWIKVSFFSCVLPLPFPQALGFACLLAWVVVQTSKHSHPVHVWVCISQEFILSKSDAHPPPSFLPRPHPKTHHKNSNICRS